MDNKVNFLDEFSYENAGQARAIASELGYKEDYKNGVLTFSKGDEMVSRSMSELKSGNILDDRRDLLAQASKDRVLEFFNKDEAVNNFKEYSQSLRENHNLAIVKWDDLKKGSSKNNSQASDDGFTVIDMDKKVAYTGQELYKYAYEQNHVLNGKGDNIEVPLAGLDKSQLSREDLNNLNAADGSRTRLIQFSIEDNKNNRDLLDKEKIKYVAEDGNLKFDGKASAIKYVEADNNEENKKKLRQNDIDFSETGNKIKVEGVNARKLAIAAITLIYPVAGIALMVIPQREEIKNDMSLSKADMKALKAGELISKKNAKGENTLMQLDKDTNSLVSVKAKDVSIPNKINGVQLTPIQKEQLKSGNEIKLHIAGQDRAVRLDLNSANGLYIDGQLMKQTQSVKESIKDVPSNIIDEKQRLEYVGRKGVEGIDQLFAGKSDGEKTAFLEKNNLLKDYQAHQDLNKAGEKGRIQGEPIKEISEKQSTLNDNIKSTALSYSEKIGADMNKEYGKSYGMKNETKTSLKI